MATAARSAAPARPPLRRVAARTRPLHRGSRRPVCGAMPAPPTRRSFYLAFHGAPSQVISVLDAIGEQELCDAFNGFGVKPSLVYFAACSVLRDQRADSSQKSFSRFPVAARCLATPPTSIGGSPVTDMLFLHRFYRDEDPWRHLRRIYESVSERFQTGWRDRLDADREQVRSGLMQRRAGPAL